jgi:hypothetical protein
MQKCNNGFLAGLGAAAVVVLSVGGYFLHKKVLKHRLQELARRQAMNLAMMELGGDDDLYGDYDDYDEDEDGDEDYPDSLYGGFDSDGFFADKEKQEDTDE